MSKELTIGSDTFEYPTQGDDSGWGEASTDWATKVTEVLSSFNAANDIPLTSAAVNNNVTVPTNVNGMLFDTASVLSFTITYIVVRQDTGATTNVQYGTLEGVSDGSNWTISDTYTGDAGMTFTITTAGQVQYYSSDMTITNGYTGLIKFKATTFAQ